MTVQTYNKFKGTVSQYVALHMWVKYHKGKPTYCDECGTTEAKRYEWANISGEYKRDLSDYRSLCPSCHRRIDRGNMCGRGLHEMNSENTYTKPNGDRRCRVCHNAYQLERYHKEKNNERHQ